MGNSSFASKSALYRSRATFPSLEEVTKARIEHALRHRRKAQSHTSLAVTFKASHSILGRMFRRNEGLYSMSDCSSSQSWKWSGKDSGDVLHALMAQVRKFTVSIFMVGESCFHTEYPMRGGWRRNWKPRSGLGTRRVHLEEAHTWKGRTLQGNRATRVIYSINIVFNSSYDLPTYSNINFIDIT